MKPPHISNLRLWFLSISISVIAAVIITHEWSMVQHSYGSDAAVIRNPAQLEDLLQRRDDTIQFAGELKPYRIPTGFFIQSLAFVDASDVNVTGYIWQKYPEDYPEDFEKGIIFPEEVDSVNNELEKAYETVKEVDGVRYHLIGWYFDVTMRQSFDYTDYPLDMLTVWLRIWPKDMVNDERIILVPDFESYEDTDKLAFGLDTEIVHGEWKIDQTYFSYKEIPYDTDFGFSEQDETEEYAYTEFTINVELHRKFINAFIINLVPLFIVALLLFAQMLTLSEEENDRFGASVFDAIATCSALFFVVLLAHIQVRSQFVGSPLVYIEYFYLLMYVMILLTATDSFVFASGDSRYLKIFNYRDNLIPKLAYWPIVLWSMAVVTWIVL